MLPAPDTYVQSGEYDDDYKDVANSPKISTFPVSDPTRWTVLLDAILLANNNTVVPLNSTVPGAPSDKAVVMLDSGTSYTYVDPLLLLCMRSPCAHARVHGVLTPSRFA